MIIVITCPCHEFMNFGRKSVSLFCSDECVDMARMNEMGVCCSYMCTYACIYKISIQNVGWMDLRMA